MKLKLLLILRSDELVRTIVVLRIPWCEGEALKSYLSRSECKVEAWCFDQPPSAPGNASPLEPVRDLLNATSVKDIHDPIVSVQQDDEAEQIPKHLILLWEVELLLHRPRLRMPEPSVVLHAVLHVTATGSEDDSSGATLIPFEPMEPNVLGPLRHLPGLKGTPPYLAASRLERVVPSAPRSTNQLRVQHMSPKYRLLQAVIARMRYTRLATPSPTPTTIASLDVDVIPYINITAVIESVEVTMANGTAEDLMPDLLPMQCRSKDSITFLYRLRPSRQAIPTSTPVTQLALPNIDVLSISLRFSINLTDASKALVKLDWTTNVDFFQALNPNFGAPSQPIQRNNRPNNLPLGGPNTQLSQTLNSSLQPLSEDNHVTISFTAPNEPVRMGEPFTWQVLIVNHSKKAAKYTMIPLPRIPRNAPQTSHFARRNAPKSSTASFHPAERRHAREDGDSEIDFAQAVIDENVVYAMQHFNTIPADTDLLALTAELRVGPLGAGQCYEGQIEMVAFKEGTLQVDAIRVVDLTKEAEEGIGAAGVMTDVRDLPDVVVYEGDSATGK